jgi:uncharacterized protein (DUF305 family)
MRNGIFRLPTLLVGLVTAAVVIAGCGSAKPSTSAANATDRAFVQQMIPHHMTAVKAAQTAMRGRSSADQVAGLEHHQRPAGRDRPDDPDSPEAWHPARRDAEGGHSSDHTMSDAQTLGTSMAQMGLHMTSLGTARPFDRAFIDMMIPHHQGAVRMAHAELAKGKNPQLRALAQRIVKAQDREIREMNQWRTQWYGAASPAGGTPQE